MAAVTFSPKSRQDLLDIGDHIAKDSRANARRFVGKLMEQCQRIGHAPLGYAGREDLAPGLRMAALGRYVIFFRVIEARCALSGCCMAPAICPQCLAVTARNLPFD